jgi:hypothetical protein
MNTHMNTHICAHSTVISTSMFLFLGVFAKFQKATISFVTSVCLSVSRPIFVSYIATQESIHSFISNLHTTGPQPRPKRFLHLMRSRASSFKSEYPLLSPRSSCNCLRLLSRLLVTSIRPFIFPSITYFRRQFLRKVGHILRINCEYIGCPKEHLTLRQSFNTACQVTSEPLCIWLAWSGVFAPASGVKIAVLVPAQPASSAMTTWDPHCVPACKPEHSRVLRSLEHVSFLIARLYVLMFWHISAVQWMKIMDNPELNLQAGEQNSALDISFNVIAFFVHNF